MEEDYISKISMSLKKYYARLRESLSMDLEGIVLDIDDTLCTTNLFWAQFALDNFSNPEGITAEELIKKYRYVKEVPYFGEDVNQWVETHIKSNSAKLDLPVMDGAVEAIKNISQVVPIGCYISGRPQNVLSGTRKWLGTKGFPKSRLVLQPPIELLSAWGINDCSEWKAKLLEYLYPYVNSVVDDSLDIVKYLNQGYKGRVYLFSHDVIEDCFENVYCCRDWRAVETLVIQISTNITRQMR